VSRARLALLGASLAVLAACSQPEGPAALTRRPLVAERIAALESALPPEPEAGPVDPEHVAGLLHFLARARGRERDLPLLEVRELGDGAIPQLQGALGDTSRNADLRAAAIELLAALGTRRAIGTLCDHLERAPEAWVRAHCAWRLGEAGRDLALPRLVLRLNYERDPEARFWIASSLGAMRNDAGLETLWAIAQGGQEPELAAAAATRLEELASAAGATDAREHWALFASGDPDRRLRRHSPSTELRLEIWRLVERLSGAHFQLRGVDDARFALARLGPAAAEVLAEALQEEDVYVRVHSAQCLERMGPGAFDAGPALMAGLQDPELAPAAALALGAIGYPLAESRLQAALSSGTPHELRVAAVEALGRLRLPSSSAALSSLFASEEALDLRERAAQALVALGRGRDVAPALIGWMESREADRHAAESAFARWLSEEQSPAALELAAAWRELAPPPGVIPTPAQDEQRIARRAALARAALPRL
jgi:HEAT repeat protein